MPLYRPRNCQCEYECEKKRIEGGGGKDVVTPSPLSVLSVASIALLNMLDDWVCTRTLIVSKGCPTYENMVKT